MLVSSILGWSGLIGDGEVECLAAKLPLARLFEVNSPNLFVFDMGGEEGFGI